MKNYLYHETIFNTLPLKPWQDHLDGEEADRVSLHDGKVVAIFETKKPGKDLWAAPE